LPHQTHWHERTSMAHWAILRTVKPMELAKRCDPQPKVHFFAKYDTNLVSWAIALPKLLGRPSMQRRKRRQRLRQKSK
jgi:hypothetical protein